MKNNNLIKNRLIFFLIFECLLIIASQTTVNNSLGYQNITTDNSQCSTKPKNPAIEITIQAGVPFITYSSYFGTNDSDFVNGIAVDQAGNYYLTGYTHSENFPTYNAYQSSKAGDLDVYITKFSPNHEIIFSTYLGGIGREAAKAITVDSDGNSYIVGITHSDDFPVKNAYNSTKAGGYDIFLAKFDPNGELLFCTYFGGGNSDFGLAIALDDQKNIYITGYTTSSNFPTFNAFNNTFGGLTDAFVAIFSTNGSLLFSTYLGGNASDLANGIVVDKDGNCYVTGRAVSTNFPIKNGYDETHNGSGDVFVTKIDSNRSIVYSTFFGGSDYEEGFGISLDEENNCYITGATSSSDFELLNAFDNTLNGTNDAFIFKLNSTGGLVFSSYLGGSSQDYAYAIVSDPDGTSYITGYTYSNDFPTKNAYKNTYGGAKETFLAGIHKNGTLLFSTFLGGSLDDEAIAIAYAGKGKCFITGQTNSVNFPTTGDAYNKTHLGGTDIFVTSYLNDYFAPIISNIHHTPQNPTEQDEVHIYAVVIDNYQIENVWLRVRVNASSWQNYSMTEISDSFYNKSLGQFTIGDFVEYYIISTDVFGYSSASDIQSLTIIAYTPPQTSTTITRITTIATTVILIGYINLGLFLHVNKKKNR